MKKYDIINLLNSKYGYRRFLEISTPTTGFTFSKVDSSNLDVCHRLVYNSPIYHDDQQATTYRTALEVADKMLRAIGNAADFKPYDCIFIDAFHTYKSSAVDIAGAFALLKDDGAIIIHDCNPANVDMATPVFKKGGWCGVTYAAYIDFVIRRGNIQYFTVDTDYGCGVVFKRAAQNFDEATKRARDWLLFEWEVCRDDFDKMFYFFEKNRKSLLNLISPTDFYHREGLSIPTDLSFSSDSCMAAPQPALALSVPTSQQLDMQPASHAVTSTQFSTKILPKITDKQFYTRWWESKPIIRHINRLYCGKEFDDSHSADFEIIKSMAKSLPILRCISIGTKNGYHEIQLLKSGLVDEIDLFQVSVEQVDGIIESAKNTGVINRLHIYNENIFEKNFEERYQLIYWKNSLSYLPNVKKYISLSYDLLQDGGIFLMNDFVGENRMQYTDRQLNMAERARSALSLHYLKNPHVPDQLLPIRPNRPNLSRIIDSDQNKFMDSSNIIPAIRDIFPKSIIKNLGGVVYLLALSDVIANFDEFKDKELLQTMLVADEFAAQAGETIYAVAYSRKE